MAYEVKPVVDLTIGTFEELIDEDMDDATDSHLRKFRIVDEDEVEIYTCQCSEVLVLSDDMLF